jgi:hypothetical protein
MPKTRRAQMLIRMAMQADYLRNAEPRPGVLASPPPPGFRGPIPKADVPEARREIEPR